MKYALTPEMRRQIQQIQVQKKHSSSSPSDHVVTPVRRSAAKANPALFSPTASDHAAMMRRLKKLLQQEDLAKSPMRRGELGDGLKPFPTFIPTPVSTPTSTPRTTRLNAHGPVVTAIVTPPPLPPATSEVGARTQVMAPRRLFA